LLLQYTVECILQALDNLGERYTLRGNDIIITSKKYYVEAKLSRQNDGKYVLTGDTDVLTENFQKRLVNNYKSLCDSKERRIEEERKKYVESQKKKICEKAKAMGYSVKETIVKDKIQLVLVKRTY